MISNGFDWNKHKNDCVYAMRRIMYQCEYDDLGTPSQL